MHFTFRVKFIFPVLAIITWVIKWIGIDFKKEERKLGSLGRVHGIVVGAFGEGSDDLHSLIHHLAVSRVRYAGPQLGRRGQLRTEEAEIAISTTFLRKTLSICAVRSQAQVLLGGLEVIGQAARPQP